MFGIFNYKYERITDIYEAMNGKAESFFEWAQAHPKYGRCLQPHCLSFGLQDCAPLEMGMSLAIQQHAVVL